MTDAIPDETWTLTEARAWLRDRVEDGANCPCCSQFSKVYYRKINSSMVRALVALYLRRAEGFVHLPSVDPSRGEAARLSYWQLIEEEPGEREDGGRAGWWCITEKGEEWLHGRIPVPTYARIYDGRLLGLTGEADYWVKDAVKEKFDLRALLEGP